MTMGSAIEQAGHERDDTMKTELTFLLNGSEVCVSAESGQRLIDLLRGPLGQTGTKEGCGEGECDACTVIVDGRPMNSCLFPALEVEGRSVTTIEGLMGPNHALSSLQKSFVQHGAIQCGFCSPGMILSAQALLERYPDPTEEQIRRSLVGNLCRCTGYQQIVEAIQAEAEARKAKGVS
jgi:carbon-monoxide dehydrogenase small subunit